MFASHYYFVKPQDFRFLFWFPILYLFLVPTKIFARVHENLHAIVIRKSGGKVFVYLKGRNGACIIPDTDLEPVFFAKVCMFPFILLLIPISMYVLNICISLAPSLLVIILAGGIEDVIFTYFALKTKRDQLLIRSYGRSIEFIKKQN